MSVSNISSASTSVYQSSGQQQGMRYYMKQLSQALQSGDLSAAQQAYNSISQLPQFQNALASQSAGSSSNSTGGSSTFVQALTQIGNDLQSGDLSSAQQAFSSLQQQLQGTTQTNAADSTGQAQGASGHHHHHHASDASSLLSSTSDSNSTTSSSSSANDQILAMLTNIENTLTGIGSDLTNGSSYGSTAANNTATTNSLLNILA